MASKRKFDIFDPNKSDSDDLDYGAQSSPPPRSKPRAQSRKSKSATRKPVKRRRETYNDSDGEIEPDSEDVSEEESFGQQSEEEQVVEKNPRTGRSVRSVAKKPVKYEEPSDDDIEADDSDRRPKQILNLGRRGRAQPEIKKKSLIVKLKIPSLAMEGAGRRSTRTGSSRPTTKRGSTPQAQGASVTRRSSRISHSEDQPLVALTDSGRHEQVTRGPSATPEPQPLRPTRASKGLKKPPSAIMEASQEGTDAEAGFAEGEELTPQRFQGAGAAETEVQRTSPGDEEEEVEGDEIRMEMVDEEEEQVVQESMDDEDDEAPIARGGRSLRQRKRASTPPTSQPSGPARRSMRPRKAAGEPSSDFEPEGDGDADVEEDVSDSDALLKPPRAGRSSNDESTAGSRRSGRRSGRLTRKTASQRSQSMRQKSDEDNDELDPEEIADEAADLEEDRRRNRRERRRPARNTEIAFEPNLRSRGARPDYRILRPELLAQMEEEDGPAMPAATPSRGKRTGGGGTYRSLFSTFGPFGGAGGPTPVFGGPDGQGATAGVDSDSSDDEGGGFKGGQGVGGAVGMTPTSAFPRPFNSLNSEPVQGPGGGPPGLGKVKDKKALADADPLGVDTNVTFDGVGGLEDHINQLKEMVALPLLYPEVFQRFHVTPPRGVLFHGPPGTGKTLLARALASSVSSHGQKVTFYMRKGADALSKWVGEAEKQLRLLFEEARKNQPSIIFFDEIDGLAPVRSSKQEQIHASIVATLLALMDGMDGRGQVIVIGATNRPDSVDPALRRPGRFDREFYFPLPDVKGRRAIIDIHTKGWEPELKPEFKDQLSELTRGYGGADLRALCTEAALNAVQGTYPQIYSSDQKLQIDPTKIKVLAKDFMISVNKIVPSSERSAASGASALKKDIEPLLRKPLQDVAALVDNAIPRKRKATALEEAMYDDRDDDTGFERENMLRQFESSRVFRPRLLIRGAPGMGQQYLGAALLSKLEGLHVQNFDMATLMKDSTRSPEAAIVQQFEEVKRHKPGVIYIPNVDIWYRTLGESAIRTFTGLLRSIPPTEPILLLGVMEKPIDGEDKRTKAQYDKIEANMLRDLFGYSLRNQYDLTRPDQPAREEYFNAVIEFIRKAPSEFPSQENRKRRKLDVLPVAVAVETPVLEPTKAEQKAQKKKDRQTLNLLKLQIQNVMDQIKLRHKKFRNPIIEERDIAYLYDEQNPQVLTTNLNEEQMQQQQVFRPYELDRDEKGITGLREVVSNRFYYNLETVTIEKRLSNGYYKRPKDFLADIKRLAKDARTSGDQDRTLKANEMLANVEVDMMMLESQHPALVAECAVVYERELERERKLGAKIREAERRGEEVPTVVPNVPPQQVSKTTTEDSGPVVLGQQIPGVRPPLHPVTPSRLHPMSNPWSTTNGSHPSHQTNGSTVPSRPHEDSDMLDSPDLHEQNSQLYQRSAASPEQVNTQGELTQRSAHTRVLQGSQIDQYRNSASTTTSGQKTSDKSRSSGPYSVNTQLSNGARPDDHPRFSQLAEARGGSQLPDTQEQNFSSQHSQSQSSQQMPPPQSQGVGVGLGLGPASNSGLSETAAQKQSSINALLNNPAPGPVPATTTTTSLAPAKTIILDEAALLSFHKELVVRSSGLSVEQLEQVNAGMMEMVWQGRGNWNRNGVLRTVIDAFNETVRDVEAVQRVMGPSQESQVGDLGMEGEDEGGE